MMKKSQLKNGDVFIVPLDGYASPVGVVVRTNRRGVVYGLFFRGDCANEVVRTGRFEAPQESLILRAKFGDRFLVNGKWPVVGRVTDWADAKYPLPDFFRVDGSSESGFVSKYDENSFECLSEVRVAIDSIDTREFVPDRLLGSRVVELELGKLQDH